MKMNTDAEAVRYWNKTTHSSHGMLRYRNKSMSNWERDVSTILVTMVLSGPKQGFFPQTYQLLSGLRKGFSVHIIKNPIRTQACRQIWIFVLSSPKQRHTYTCVWRNLSPNLDLIHWNQLLSKEIRESTLLISRERERERSSWRV